MPRSGGDGQALYRAAGATALRIQGLVTQRWRRGERIGVEASLFVLRAEPRKGTKSGGKSEQKPLDGSEIRRALAVYLHPPWPVARTDPGGGHLGEK